MGCRRPVDRVGTRAGHPRKGRPGGPRLVAAVSSPPTWTPGLVPRPVEPGRTTLVGRPTVDPETLARSTDVDGPRLGRGRSRGGNSEAVDPVADSSRGGGVLGRGGLACVTFLGRHLGARPGRTRTGWGHRRSWGSSRSSAPSRCASSMRATSRSDPALVSVRSSGRGVPLVLTGAGAGRFGG